MVKAETLQVRQRELWENYEHLLAMGAAGIGSKYEASLLKRLDWWVGAERECRLDERYTSCIWGEGKECPDAVACCSVCAYTRRWQLTETS
jgi:hypothetical protein